MKDKKESGIKAIRKRSEMTQQQFADELGVSVWTVRDWEQGRRSPDRRSKQALLKFALKDRP